MYMSDFGCKVFGGVYEVKTRSNWIWLVLVFLCGIAGVLGIILCTLWFVVGTLFFDDPNASYGQFIMTTTGYLIIPLILMALAVYFFKKYSEKNKN